MELTFLYSLSVLHLPKSLGQTFVESSVVRERLLRKTTLLTAR